MRNDRSPTRGERHDSGGRLDRRSFLTAVGIGLVGAACEAASVPAAGTPSGTAPTGAAPTTTTGAGPVMGGNLRLATQNDPGTLNGTVREISPLYGMLNQIGNKLLWWDSQGKLVGELAERWEQNADATEITLHLRKDVSWHDGVAFTADDVAWFFTMAKGQATTFAGLLQPMQSVTALDKNTVRLKFSIPASPAIFAAYNGSSTVLPKHLYDGTDMKTNPYNLRPVGTGPFVFKEYARDQYLVLERNPNYFGVKPYVDTLTYRFFPNGQSALLALKAGDIDAFALQSPGALAPGDYAALKADARTQVAEFVGILVQRISFSFHPDAVAKHPWLSNLSVRQAIAHAIDADTICNKVLEGLWEPTWGPYPPGVDVRDTSLVRPAFDPKKAQSLLDAAGLKPDARGIRFTTDLAFSNDPNTEAVAQAIKAMLGAVGIQVNLVGNPLQAFYQKHWYMNVPKGQGDMPLAIYTGAAAPDPQYMRTLYDSRNAPRLNGAFLSIPEVDQLLDRGLAESDPAKQKEIYYRIQRILTDQVVNVWIGTPKGLMPASKRVRNLSSVSRFWIYERWNEVWLEK